MTPFAPLHIVSGYTFLKSGLTMEKIAKGIASNGYFGAGITDEGVLYGAPNFVETLTTLDKPYLIGMDVKLDEDFYSLFAINEDGYKNLIKITSTLQIEDVDFDFVSKYSSGLLCVLHTKEGKFLEDFSKMEVPDIVFRKHLASVAKTFQDNFYLGIEVTSKEEVRYANKVRLFANDFSYECIAFPKVRYLKKDDAISVLIAQAIANEEKLTVKQASGNEYFMSVSDYEKIYTKSELENTVKVIKKSEFNFNQKRGEMLHVGINNSFVMLKEKTYHILKCKHLDDQAHKDRLDYELKIINEMGYPDYFLLVEDYVNWAKNNNILVGAGRGSSAGSLVSYLLNITEVDPLDYGLQFERFLNPHRKTMPDIDVDFEDIFRDSVVDYVREKYGKDRVANVITFQSILCKQALRDVAKIYNIPESTITYIGKRLTNKDYNFAESYKKLPDFKAIVDNDNYIKEVVGLANKIEGLPRQSGTHAAGVILNNTPICEILPVCIDLNGNLITQYEGPYLEEQGFLKMDFLSLRNLTTVDLCTKLIKENKGIDLPFNQIPYKDDKEIFDLIASGKTMGLFQIESVGMRRAIKILKPACFDDVVSLISLFRPGPLDSIKSFARRKESNTPINYPTKELEEILGETFGTLVYQEQINSIAVKMAGLSLGEADMFRRAVSKKDESKLASLRDQFINGAKENDYKLEVATKMFDSIYKFANYGFNKSHAVVYAILACRMAYLKAHYPIEFYSAILQTGTSTSDVKFGEYISEMKKVGINLLPPNINTSGKYFAINNNNLMFPLNNIKNINELMVDKILEEREKDEFKDIFDFALRMFPQGLKNTELTRLVEAGCFDFMNINRSSLKATVLPAMQYAELNYSEDGQLNIGIEPMPVPKIREAEDDPLDNLDKEYDAIGMMLSASPLDFKQDLIKEKGAVSILESEELEKASICAIIKSKKIINTKKSGLPMCYLKVYDSLAELEVTVFPKVFSQCTGVLDKNNIVIIKGNYEQNSDEPSFIANEITLLEE